MTDKRKPARPMTDAEQFRRFLEAAREAAVEPDTLERVARQIGAPGKTKKPKK